MISGTTGLLGCADGSLLMQKKKRTALEATIDVVGRDQQDQILYLQKKQQAENQLARLENKQRYLSQKERSHRTHQLCNIGGALAHFFPKLMDLSREEIYDFVEKLYTDSGGDRE